MAKIIEIADETAEIVAELVEMTGRTAEQILDEAVRAKRDKAAVERWLHEDVAASYDEYQADPAGAIDGDELLRRLHERSAQRRAAPG